MKYTKAFLDEYFKTHITGYLGFFDVLGYKDLISNNKLDKVVDIYNKTLLDLAEKAIIIEGKHEYARVADQQPVKYLAFSDTIILYQDESLYIPRIELKSRALREIQSLKIFMETVSYLLRLSFERGIPIRGAVSYGRYYATERGCILGEPIVEAYKMEQAQDWAGAIICKSVQEKFYDIGANLARDIKRGNVSIPEEMSYLKAYSSPADFKNRALIYAIAQSLAPYKVPYNSKLSETRVDVAFCWDDVFIEWLGINSLPVFDPDDDDSIKEKVEGKFKSHNKSIEKSDIQAKIKNTSDFLIYLKHIHKKNTGK
jgi:hypothetical protein